VDIYEAMLTGPQSMPVFNDQNITPENKKNVIAFINGVYERPQQGGMNLGNLGPVSEGMFIWIFGLGIMVGIAVWLGSKAA
jgi:ubiquinol-cytochrome c reductase cytochrome c subunit